jgi:hypothetical protein
VNQHPQALTLRSTASSYIVWLGTLLSFCALYLLVAIRNGTWYPFWALFALVPVAAHWIGYRKIDVDRTRVTIQRPFRGRRDLDRAEIGSVELKVGGDTLGERLGPPFRLEFTVAVPWGTERLRLNAKFYKREDIRRLIELLGSGENKST